MRMNRYLGGMSILGLASVLLTGCLVAMAQDDRGETKRVAAVQPEATAKKISAPLVRDAAKPKTSTTKDTRALMDAAPMKMWKEGDPVRVKDDIRGLDSADAVRYRPQKQVDPVLSPGT